jgi:hypothetical protein
MKDIFKYPHILYRKIFKRDLYNVGLVRAPIHSFLDPQWRPDIVWLPERSKTGTFIADPFGIEYNGKQYLLCEYFDYREPKARIMGAELNNLKLVDDLKDAIEIPCHISYPFLFLHDDQVFCIPETSHLNEMALFRAESMPSGWRKEAVLLGNLPAVDPSIINFDGRWWLFYGDRRTKEASLYISYSDSLYGPWLPHAKQPVKTDIASARSGGTPFVHEGKLYRPAQDCSRIYGGRVVINEVVVLTPDRFEEKMVAFVQPDKSGPYPDGLHTLSSLGNITLLDGKCEKFILAATVRSVKTFLKKKTNTKKQEDF